MTEFSVTCSWDILNGGQLKDAVHVVHSDETGFDLMDVISAERCLQVKRINDDACNLEMSFNPGKGFEMVKISVICEARFIEIYTHLDEYVTTTDSVLIDADFDDFAAYRSETTLVKPLTYCKLKFVSLRYSDSMWLYGISFLIRPNCSPRSELGPMKMSDIVTKLQEDGLQMSDGAKRLAELLQTHGSSTRNVPAYLSMFMGMMNNVKTTNSSTNSEESIKVPKEINRLEVQETSCASSKEDTAISSDQLTLLKPLVDSAMKQLEDRLWEKIRNHMEMQEQRYMDKLDQILTRLPFNN